MSQPMDSPENDHVFGVFPIPGLVVFPGVMQGLHVFEPRYRALIEDTLNHDSVFVVATPVEGQTGDSAPLAIDACLVKIHQHEQHADGKYDLAVIGISHVKLGQEHEQHRGYRRFSIKTVAEASPLSETSGDRELRDQLVSMFRELLSFSKADSSSSQVAKDLEMKIPLPLLTHLIAFVVPFPTAWKLQLLAEPDPRTRAQTIIEMREQISGPAEKPSSSYPPDFSLN